MKLDKIKKARLEANRFLARLEAFERIGKINQRPLWAYPKETSALRRASMELTRALAEMRRP